MKNKKRIIRAGLIYTSILLVVTIIIGSKSNFAVVEPTSTLNGLPVISIHNSYVLDASTPEKAIGASKYVFIAKINDILRTEYVNPVEIETGLFSKETVYDPVTVYSVSVVENIKGELITSDQIELQQYGGINQDGKSYQFVEGTEYLNVGNYYLISTGALTEGGDLEVSDPNRFVSLGYNLDFIKTVQNGKVSNEVREAKETRVLVETIETYMRAIKNEEAPNTDVYIEGATIPVLEFVSKYDVDYK